MNARSARSPQYGLQVWQSYFHFIIHSPSGDTCTTSSTWSVWAYFGNQIWQFDGWTKLTPQTFLNHILEYRVTCFSEEMESHHYNVVHSTLSLEKLNTLYYPAPHIHTYIHTHAHIYNIYINIYIIYIYVYKKTVFCESLCFSLFFVFFLLVFTISSHNNWV